MFSQLRTLSLSPCVRIVSASDATPNRDFENGVAAFRNGLASQLRHYETALGANLGVLAVPRLSAALDTRSPLSLWVLYANAKSARQSAVDWANFAASRGQAGVWQNVGRLTALRAGIPLPGGNPWEAPNTQAVDAVAAGAWATPTTDYWWGLAGSAGFERAFGRAINLLGRASVTDADVRASVTQACTCMNTGTCPQ